MNKITRTEIQDISHYALDVEDELTILRAIGIKPINEMRMDKIDKIFNIKK